MTMAQMPIADFEESVNILFGNDQQKATATLENAQKKYPNTYTTYYLQAIMQFRNGDNNGAMMSQSNAIKANPKFAEAYDARAQLFEVKGMYDKAIADQSRAIEIDPSNVSYLISRIRYYFKNEQYRQALEDTKTRIKLDPTSVYSYYDAADFSKRIDPNANVDSYFTQMYAAKEIPRYRADIVYGQFLLSQSKFEESRQKYEAAVAVAEKEFTAEDFNNYAVVCYKTKMYDKAIACYDKATKLSPQSIDYLQNLGSVYNTQLNYEMLKATARRILAIDSNDFWGNKYMAIGLVNTGEEALANEYNDKAVRNADINK